MSGTDHTASPIRRLLTRYAWRHRWSYAAGVVFLWLTNWLTVSIPGEIGRAIDSLRVGDPMDPATERLMREWREAQS